MLDKTLIILVDKIFNVYAENDTFRYHELVDILYSYLYEFISKKTGITITDKQIYSKLDIIKCIDFMIDNSILLNIHDDYLIYIYKSNIYNPLVIINILNTKNVNKNDDGDDDEDDEEDEDDDEDSDKFKICINKTNLFRDVNDSYKIKLNDINFYNDDDYIYRTFEICKIAIENGCDLSNIPEELRTYELCRLTIEHIKISKMSRVVNCYNFKNHIHSIPKEIMTKELYKIAWDKYNITNCPQIFRDKILVEIGYDINDFPEK
jgi:hypothetical protein